LERFEELKKAFVQMATIKRFEELLIWQDPRKQCQQIDRSQVTEMNMGYLRSRPYS